MWNIPPFQKTIPTIGGTINSPTGNASASFPANLFSTDTVMELLNVPTIAETSAQLKNAGISFWLRLFGGGGTNAVSNYSDSVTDDFTQPVTLTVNYDPAVIQHLNINELAIYHWDESIQNWIKLNSVVDNLNHTVTGQTTTTGKFDVQAPLVCTNDLYEPNDIYSLAVSVSSGSFSGIFDISNDEDWYWIQAKASAEYIVEATSLGSNVDPIIELYDFGGDELIMTDDNSGPGNGFRIKWTAMSDTTYFLRILPVAGSTIGCNAGYDFNISATFHQYLPLVKR